MFLKLYEGKEKPLWEEMVTIELEGCSLGIKLAENGADDIELSRPVGLNTGKDEFAVSQTEENYLFMPPQPMENQLYWHLLNKTKYGKRELSHPHFRLFQMVRFLQVVLMPMVRAFILPSVPMMVCITIV